MDTYFGNLSDQLFSLFEDFVRAVAGPFSFDRLKYQRAGRAITGGYEEEEEMREPHSGPLSDFVVQPERGAFTEAQSRFGRGHDVFESFSKIKTLSDFSQ